jgi:hypothetical protein
VGVSESESERGRGRRGREDKRTRHPVWILVTGPYTPTPAHFSCPRPPLPIFKLNTHAHTQSSHLSYTFSPLRLLISSAH